MLERVKTSLKTLQLDASYSGAELQDQLEDADIEKIAKAAISAMPDHFTDAGKLVADYELMRERIAQLAAIVAWYETFRPIGQYHEDDGNALWWRLPICEPPYCGTPSDDAWIGDSYTHFTPIVRNEILKECNKRMERKS